jgi:hypothetical protein
MATGFDIWRYKKFRQLVEKFYFWNFILWFITVGSCLGEWRGTHIFSIEQLNQRKITRPKAQSIYQRMGEAPWGRIQKSWSENVVMTQPPEATVRYEWMERLMPRNMVVNRPERVLVIGTVEDYTTIGHKVGVKQLSAR